MVNLLFLHLLSASRSSFSDSTMIELVDHWNELLNTPKFTNAEILDPKQVGSGVIQADTFIVDASSDVLRAKLEKRVERKVLKPLLPSLAPTRKIQHTFDRLTIPTLQSP